MAAPALLAAAGRSDCGFDAVIVGENERAFCGTQFREVMAALEEHGIQLWLPEADGPVALRDPEHRALMVLLGAQSRREAVRLRHRVLAAMRTQACEQGRFWVGGRRMGIGLWMWVRTRLRRMGGGGVGSISWPRRQSRDLLVERSASPVHRFLRAQLGWSKSASCAAAEMTSSPYIVPGPDSSTRTTGADRQNAATVSPEGRRIGALTEHRPGVRCEMLSTQPEAGVGSVRMRAADPPFASGSKVPTGTDARSSAGESTLARQRRCSPRRTQICAVSPVSCCSSDSTRVPKRSREGSENLAPSWSLPSSSLLRRVCAIIELTSRCVVGTDRPR